jgi:AcrR family transcriptional regulator
MTRLARGRDSHLTAHEIAKVTLETFDRSTQSPSIRQVAGVLGASPSAIYHHFTSWAAVLEAAVDLVWDEAMREFLTQIPDPFSPESDPVDALVTAGLVARRAFGRHYQISPYLAATPRTTRFMSATVVLMTHLFERLGMTDMEAANAFHTYASFSLGAVLFSCARRLATDQLSVDPDPAAEAQRIDSSGSSGMASHAIDEMMILSSIDPDSDEQLFVEGLHILVDALVSAHRSSVERAKT